MFDGAVHKLGKEQHEELFDGKVEESRKEEAQCAFETERLLRRQGDFLFLRAVLFGGLLPKGEGEEHDERENELHDGDRKMPEKSAETMVEREMMRLMTPAEERSAQLRVHDGPGGTEQGIGQSERDECEIDDGNKKACHVGFAHCV